MESRWPEPTPEPDEPPRWPGWAAVGVIAAAAAILAPGAGNWFGSFGGSWQLPSFTLPDVRLPDLDLRGRTETPSPSEAASIAEALTNAGAPGVPQQVPFETCVSMLAETGNAFGQRPLFSIESSDDRQIAVFKFLEGDLTITCSADGTMTMEQRP